MSASSIDYVRLLDKFNKLPERSENFLEIAGYPHYENVCSNILSFFLHPKNEHGLKDVFYSSLMKLAGTNYKGTTGLQINREVVTLKGGRLDIVILTDDHVVGIENKIHHYLNNNLEDYGSSIDNCAKSAGLDTVKIILSIRREKESVGFRSITYREYWGEIRNELSNRALEIPAKWNVYLHEFMRAIENTYGGDMEFNEIDKFYTENDDAIERLILGRNKFQSRLFERIQTVHDEVDKPSGCIKKWIYSRKILVLDFELTNKLIAVELEISINGWVLQVLGRNAESRQYLNSLLSVCNISTDKHDINNKQIVNRYKLEEDQSSICKDLVKLCNSLVEKDKQCKADTTG